jgi:hypothetical protein
MDCELCDDPAVFAESQRLLWETDEPPLHIHLCDTCKAVGCNFTEPNGEGEHCSDLDDEDLQPGFVLVTKRTK